MTDEEVRQLFIKRSILNGSDAVTQALHTAAGYAHAQLLEEEDFIYLVEVVQ